jgi:hypothetical protein
LPNLIKIDLAKNKLDDEAFVVLQRMMKNGSVKLSYINLSYNNIKLGNPQLLVELLKAAAAILNLDLSHNLIDDSTT